MSLSCSAWYLDHHQQWTTKEALEQLIYNVVLVSDVQQSDSVLHVYILFQIHFPYRFLQNIECSSLGYTVGPCWLSILYLVVCLCSSQAPNLSLPTLY